MNHTSEIFYTRAQKMPKRKRMGVPNLHRGETIIRKKPFATIYPAGCEKDHTHRKHKPPRIMDVSWGENVRFCLIRILLYNRRDVNNKFCVKCMASIKRRRERLRIPCGENIDIGSDT
jgi:hypothetical protein